MFDTFRDLPIATLVANFSTNVARLLGVEGGTLAPGSPADITGLHLERPWTVDPAAFLSKGRVTPFSGQTFDVKPAMSVVGGAIVYAVDRSGRPLQPGPNAPRKTVKA